MAGGRLWTPEEETYLMEKWGQASIPTIAKHLNRTVHSIKIRASRLHLGPDLMGGDYVTFNQLMLALTGGTQSYSYQKESWIKKRGLPVHAKKVVKNSFLVVYLDEFWAWAEQHRSFIDFSKMEPLALGAEPAWVAQVLLCGGIAGATPERRSHSAPLLRPWSKGTSRQRIPPQSLV